MTDAQRALLTPIGAALRAARDAAGMTQEQVADHFDIRAAYVLRVEKGRVNVSATRLVELAAYYGINGSDLLDAAIEQQAASAVDDAT